MGKEYFKSIPLIIMPLICLLAFQFQGSLAFCIAATDDNTVTSKAQPSLKSDPSVGESKKPNMNEKAPSKDSMLDSIAPKSLEVSLSSRSALGKKLPGIWLQIVV